MDINSIIVIIIALGAIYLFVRLVVGPIIKAILGIIILLTLLYLLQRFFNFSLPSPWGTYLNFNTWGLNWLLSPINYYVDQLKVFLTGAWANFPKSLNK